MDLDEPVAKWCVATLGVAPVRELFRRSRLSAVLGLELGDGREIVLKIRPPSPRLEPATAVQRHGDGKGFPCPEVLADPTPRSASGSQQRRNTRPVIGHIDWEAHNLDWIGDTPVMVHDWDTLAIRTEAAITGAATAVTATLDQSAAFLDAYRRA